jgi:hypothetical protein
MGVFSEKKPFKYLKNVSSLTADGLVKTVFAAGKAEAALYSHMDGAELIYASGPDNPTHTDAAYVIQRARGKSAVFVNIIETYKAGGLPVILDTEVTRDGGTVEVNLTTVSGERMFRFLL